MDSNWLRNVFGFFLFSLVVALATPRLGAVEFTSYPGKDMPGMDIGPGVDIVGTAQVCQNLCDHDPRCMAFTWVRSGVQGPSAKCWIKAEARILNDGGRGLLVDNPYTVTGVKSYRRIACWARHIFNLKFCNVILAGTSDPSLPFGPDTLECPAGSRPARVSLAGIPGRIDRFCVVRLANDPGGLLNCTDAFGGDAREAGVLGNRVNHACLDAN